MPSIDSQEIDAALDSVRMDLHQEVQQRDELLARQFEQELRQEGQSILEFEAAISWRPAQGGGHERAETESLSWMKCFRRLPRNPRLLPQKQPHSQVGTAAPSFAIKPASARSWLPILVLVLLALLAVAYFWFRG